MKTRSFVIALISMWLLSGSLALWHGDMAWMGSFGDSFGAVNTLFSGGALVMAINSMILQQKQNAEFEQKTLAAMAQQAETIQLIKTSLVQQANVARVTAMTYLIEREEQRIETLKEWGVQSYKDENYYSKGIKAAKARIEDYQAQIKEVGTAPC